MFVHAVIIARNGPCPDVHTFADLGVAKITQMIGFRSHTELHFLQFHEVPDFRRTPDDRPRAQARKWAHDAALFQPGSFNHARVQYRHAPAQHTVRDARMGADHTVFADRRPAFQSGVRINDGITSDPHLRIHKTRLRSQERNAVGHQPLPDSSPHQPFRFR